MGEEKENRKSKMSSRLKVLFALHLLLMFFSLSGIFSKLASTEPFMSPAFIGYYAGVLIILFVYAIGWQQIIKRLPLSVAYTNKALALAWGIIWGVLFFAESITVGKIIGAVMVVAGAVIFSLPEGGQDNE